MKEGICLLDIWVKAKKSNSAHSSMLFISLLLLLGTEPSLFRMPVTESRFIDFELRRKELREFEEIIWRNSRENASNY